jgi:hypothetical protein
VDSISRGNASQFFIAGELCRRGYSAVVTLGNTPNVDILCSNKEGTRFAHIQVKTFVPGNTTCSVGMKATKDFGPSFFWVLGGIPRPNAKDAFVYYIIPADVMAKNVNKAHELWLATPGKKGQPHKDNTVRTVAIPPKLSFSGWSIKEYENRWDLIEAHLRHEPTHTGAPATDAPT